MEKKGKEQEELIGLLHDHWYGRTEWKFEIDRDLKQERGRWRI